MSNEVQDVEVETVVESTPEVTQDEKVETTEEVNAEDETSKADAEPVEVDYREKAEKLEKKLAAEQAKINRQRAALSQSQQKIQELAKVQEQQAPAQAQTTEPNENDYETYDDYETARVSYYKEQGRIEALKESQQQMAQQQAAIKDMEFQKIENDYRQSNPVYDDAKAEVINFHAATPVPEAVGHAISAQAEKEGGLPELINYFGQNGGERLGELEAITRMTPIEAAVEVYKIQQSLKSAPAPEKAKPKPAPIKKVRGTGTTKPTSKMSGADLLKAMKV